MKTKKILCFLLAALLMLPLLVSCGESETNKDAPSAEAEPAAEPVSSASPTPEEEETEPEETLLTDGLPDTDFGGYGFRIACGQGNGVPMAEYVISMDDYTGTPVKDALRDSTLYIEQRFNVKLSYDLYGNDSNTFMKSIKTADDAFDVMVAPDYITYAFAPKGYLLDMKSVGQFDFSKPWWPPIMLDTLTINDSLYAMSSYLSYLGIHWTRALMVNKDIAGELMIGVPYDAVREGTWTLDAMLAYVRDVASDLDGNGKIDASDRIGFVTGSQTYYCFQESVGVTPYSRNAEGRIELSLDLDRTDCYVAKMRELMGTQDYLDAGDFFGSAVFQTGNSLVNLGEIGDAYDIYSSFDFTYGFLPCPKLDETQKDYVNCCTDGPWGIPTTVSGEQTDIVGTICEALSCYNYQHVLPVYFDVSMKRRMADSPDDAEMLQIIADTRMTSFAYAYDLPFKNILGDLGASGTGVGSYYEKQQRSAVKLLDKMLANFEKIIN